MAVILTFFTAFLLELTPLLRFLLNPCVQHSQLLRGVEPVFPFLHDRDRAATLTGEFFNRLPCCQMILPRIENRRI